MNEEKKWRKKRREVGIFLRTFLTQKITPVNWLLGFLGINAARIWVEFFVVVKPYSASDVLTEYIHNLFFFGLTILFLWLVVSFILKVKPQEISFAMSLACLIIILPPLFDMAKTGGAIYWSFYALTDFRDIPLQFITFFGHLPPGIYYFGSKIGFITGIVFCALFIFWHSRSFFKTIIGAIFAYIVIFIMGTFPSLFAFVYYFFEGSKRVFEVKDFHVFTLFGGANHIFGVRFFDLHYYLVYNLNFLFYCIALIALGGLFFWMSPQKFWAWGKNLRFPQIIYHFGLFVVGLGLGYLTYPENFHLSFFSLLALLTLFGAIFLAWETSVIINDIADWQIDQVSNAWRPLPQKVFNLEEYSNFGVVLLFLSLLGGIIIGVKFALILAVYQFMAWAYSSGPYRLKRFPVVATALSSLAGILMVFLGWTLFSGEANLINVPWRVIFLLFIAFTFSLPLKDFKDIEGDRADGIWTIPVIFGEKNGKLIVAIGIFLSFVASVFILNEARLFWWAIIFGSGAFMVIVNKEIKNTKVFWWILGIIFCYLLVLVKTIFLK